jgi:hypothetical protein
MLSRVMISYARSTLAVPRFNFSEQPKDPAPTDAKEQPAA